MDGVLRFWWLGAEVNTSAPWQQIFGLEVAIHAVDVVIGKSGLNSQLKPLSSPCHELLRSALGTIAATASTVDRKCSTQSNRCYLGQSETLHHITSIAVTFLIGQMPYFCFRENVRVS